MALEIWPKIGFEMELRLIASYFYLPRSNPPPIFPASLNVQKEYRCRSCATGFGNNPQEVVIQKCAPLPWFMSKINLAFSVCFIFTHIEIFALRALPVSVQSRAFSLRTLQNPHKISNGSDKFHSLVKWGSALSIHILIYLFILILS